MNLSYVANFLKGSNGIQHDRNFLGPIEYLLDGDGLCVLGINDTFVFLYWKEYTLVVKDRPILFDKHIYSIMCGGFHMGQVKMLLQLCTMFGLIVSPENLGSTSFFDRGACLSLRKIDPPSILCSKFL